MSGMSKKLGETIFRDQATIEARRKIRKMIEDCGGIKNFPRQQMKPVKPQKKSAPSAPATD